MMSRDHVDLVLSLESIAQTMMLLAAGHAISSARDPRAAEAVTIL